MTNPDTETYLTKREAAEILKVSERTITRYGLSGKLPRIALSYRVVRFRLSDVKALADASTQA